MTGRQDIHRKIGIHRPKEPVAPFQIALPFAISLKISAARLAFDNPDLPFGAKRHHIDTQPRRGDEFFDRHEICLPQGTAHPALKALTGQRRQGVKRITHRTNMNEK